MSGSIQKGSLNLVADVLVIGGGPAGTWAALTASAKGRKLSLQIKATAVRAVQRPLRNRSLVCEAG